MEEESTSFMGWSIKVSKDKSVFKKIEAIMRVCEEE